MTTIGFLHTAAANAETFTRAIDSLDVAIVARHVVDPGLLTQAIELGPRHSLVARRISGHIDELVADGASTVICTCSAVGAAAERVGFETGVAVIRADRPLVAEAVAIGGKVAIVATLASALEATLALVDELSGECDARTVLCADAWAPLPPATGRRRAG